jgi:hypothetical protein
MRRHDPLAALAMFTNMMSNGQQQQQGRGSHSSNGGARPGRDYDHQHADEAHDYYDGNTGRNPAEDLTNMMENIGSVREPTMFSADRERTTIEQEECRRANVGGINYVCPICEVGDGGYSDSTNSALKKVFALDRVYYMKTKDIKINKMVAVAFNKLVAVMRDAGELEFDIPNVTYVHVRYHREECDKSLRKTCWKTLVLLEMTEDHLRYKGLLVQNNGSEMMDYKNHAMLIKTTEQKLKWVKMTKDVEKEERIDYQKDLSAASASASLSKDYTSLL